MWIVWTTVGARIPHRLETLVGGLLTYVSSLHVSASVIVIVIVNFSVVVVVVCTWIGQYVCSFLYFSSPHTISETWLWLRSITNNLQMTWLPLLLVWYHNIAGEFYYLFWQTKFDKTSHSCTRCEHTDHVSHMCWQRVFFSFFFFAFHLIKVFHICRPYEGDPWN